MAIIILMAIPLVMTGMMGAIFGPSGGKDQKIPKIKLLIANNDKQFISELLMGAFNSKEMAEIFQVTVVEETEGKKLIGKGKASAFVILPENFTIRLLEDKPTAISVIKNPSERFLPTVVEEFINTIAVVLSGAVQVFRPEIKTVSDMLEMKTEDLKVETLTPMLLQSKDKIISLRKYLDPLLIELKSETLAKKNEADKKENAAKPVINFFAYILPGMSIMFLLFILETFIRDILSERDDGKLRRMMFSPLSGGEYIAARIAAAWLMGLAVFAVMALFGALAFGIQWGNYLYLMIFVAAACFWIASFLALMMSFFKNREQAGAWLSPIILVFSAFGGSFVSVDQLPASLRWISLGTPNQWFIRGIFQVNEGIFPLTPLAVFLGTGLILCFLVARFLRKRITT